MLLEKLVDQPNFVDKLKIQEQSMRQDKLTTKLQEALADAQSLAVGHDNQYIEPVHLLTALLNQDDASARSLLQRAGVNVGGLSKALTASIERLPKVSGNGGNVQAGREFVAMLNLADKEAQKRADQFVSSEMVLLALSEDKSDAGKLARENGLSRKSLESAIDTVRGGAKVDTQESEGQREALKKYTLDLTERARQGKLDPVIGRDDEIRRAIQVLQRRTKNNPVLIGEPGVGKTAIVEGLAQRIDDGGLADTRLADQHRIVFGAPLQHLDGAADLVVAADHRIELALARPFGQVQRVFFQRLALAFRFLRIDLGAAAHGVDGRLQRLARQAVFARQLAGVGLVLAQRQQHHLARHELVGALLRLLVGQVQHRDELAADLHVAAGAGHFRQALDRRGERLAQATDVDAGTLQQRARAGVVLVQQGGQQVYWFDVLVVVAHGQALRVGQGFLEFGGEFVLPHGLLLNF